MRRVVATAELEDPRGRQRRRWAADVLAFWFGESDEVTPAAVREAAARSLERGETFYAHNLGLAELRDGAGRLRRLACIRRIDGERIAVTSSGVNALMLATQTLVGAGDEVVAVVPVWPNLTAQPAILGARVHARPAASRAQTARGGSTSTAARARSPTAPGCCSSIRRTIPTGWTLTRAEQQALLDALPAHRHLDRRRRGLRAHVVRRRRACAPSFLDIADADDRLIVVHSFSKSFLMTGWRLGWMVLPDGASAPAIGKLIEFNTSCAPVFVQRGGLAALAHADDFVPGAGAAAAAPAATRCCRACTRCPA